jgi:hypothetical protein
MKNPVINIPEIQKEIRDKHSKFMAEYASFSEKAIADDQFLVDSAMAKINLIAICMKSEKVIDEIKILEKGPIKEMYLYKTGYNNYVRITTNGKSMIMEGYGYNISDFESDVTEGRHRINDIAMESYDWKSFTRELLDFIYVIIYQRLKAAEIKLDNDLYGKGKPPEDLVIKKVIKKKS